jgi:hypothetical protein
MIKRFAMTTALLAAGVASAFAQGRPDTRSMSCDQVQALIDARGAVVMTTGRHTYDRFVAHAGYCVHLEAREATAISTRDTNRCWVYHCKPISDGGDAWTN